MYVHFVHILENFKYLWTDINPCLTSIVILFNVRTVYLAKKTYFKTIQIPKQLKIKNCDKKNGENYDSLINNR